MLLPTSPVLNALGLVARDPRQKIASDTDTRSLAVHGFILSVYQTYINCSRAPRKELAN